MYAIIVGILLRIWLPPGDLLRRQQKQVTEPIVHGRVIPGVQLGAFNPIKRRGKRKASRAQCEGQAQGSAVCVCRDWLIQAQSLVFVLS